MLNQLANEQCVKSKSSGSFPMDLRMLDWHDYFKDYVLGVRGYLLKENPSTIEQARTQLMMLVDL